MPHCYRSFAFCLVLLTGMFALPGAAQNGRSAGAVLLRGTVRDAATGEVLIGATVLVPATRQGTATLLDGTFQLRGVAAGTATVVRAQNLGYAPQELTVTGQPGVPQTLDFKLAATGRELAEVTVAGQLDRESAGAARRTEQKADNVINIIAARTIELSPDVTVGNVVQRASGVSVVRNSGGDGQYAIIRGMDRRYNYTLVNGIKIPSPDPKTRYVPLDIFPAELLERLEVVKALTPNMEGDAIGGAMNMVMKSAPDHLVVAATAAGGFSDLFANRSFAGFSTSGLPQQSPGEAHPEKYLVQASEFSNKQVNYTPVRVPVNSLFGLTLGNRTRDGKLGLLVAGSLQNTYRGSDRLFYRPLGQPKPVPANTFTFDEIQRREYSLLQTRTGLHAKLDYAPSDRNRLSLYSLLLRLDDAQHRRIVTNDLGTGGNVPASDQSRLQRQELWAETLQGDHTLLPRLALNWSAVFARATFTTPDATDISTVQRTAANTQQGVFVDKNSHLWQRSRDQDLAAYANLSFAATDALELTTGGMLRNKDRRNFYDYYDLTATTTGVGTNNGQVFTSYDQARFDFDEAPKALAKSSDANNYTATERIAAGYAQAKLLLARRLQVLGGVRLESTNQHYDSQLPPTEVGKSGTITYLDILPSAHLKYLLSERQNLRLSYFKGISRPNLFELVPAVTSQNSDYYDEKGNPLVKHTQANNYDFRYEHFGEAGAQLLAGIFYKSITNPIEYSFVRVGNNSYYYQPQNPDLGNATNYGAEVVFSKYVRHWGLSGNYTYTHSSVTTTKRVYYYSPSLGQFHTVTPTELTAEYPTSPTQTRPLQGQSDHIANLALLYKNERLGFNAQAAAVYTGRRINTVSPYKDLDQWQRATTQLDFSAEQKLPQHLTVFLKVTNLLNTPAIVEVMQAPTGDLLTAPEQTRPDRILVQRDTYSRTYLLGLRYRLN